MSNWLKNLFSRKLKAISSAQVLYTLNDPMTPELSSIVDINTESISPRYSVAGWTGRAISPNQKAAAQVFACMHITNTMIKSYYQRPFDRWAVVDTLIAMPLAGRNLNAFYDRTSLRFFVSPHPVTKKAVYTAMSPNIVAHEHGHAILDAIRPDLWSSQSLEIFAFHESFGDIISILNTLQSKMIIAAALIETSNDLRKSNIVSRIAEEMGNALYHLGAKNVHVDALRQAANSLTYVQPETLPSRTGTLDLSQEPHNFSRVFTGAWYECLVCIYEEEVKKGMLPEDALAMARDKMGRLTMNAVPLAAANPRFYNSFAKSMLAVSMSVCPQYQGLLRKVFSERRIISNSFMVKKPLIKTGEREGSVFEMRLADHKTDKLKASRLPLKLLKAKIQVPAESYDLLGISCDKDEAIDSAFTALGYLHNANQIDDDPLDMEKGFSVIDGKLVRNRSCM